MDRPNTPNLDKLGYNDRDRGTITRFLIWLAQHRELMEENRPVTPDNIFDLYIRVDRSKVEEERVLQNQYERWKKANKAPAWQTVMAVLKKAGFNKILTNYYVHHAGVYIRSSKYMNHVEVRAVPPSKGYATVKNPYDETEYYGQITQALENAGYAVTPSEYGGLEVRNKPVEVE